MSTCLEEAPVEYPPVNEKEEGSPTRPQPAAFRLWESADQAEAYELGVLDGNAAAVRVMVGCLAGLQVVVDPSIPEGVIELRVRDAGDVAAPSRYLNLVMPR